MVFETPTNKTQMYTVLKEIFYYYRIRRDEYEDFILPELTLERMIFSPKTIEELKESARTLLLSKQIREKREYVSSLTQEKVEKETLRDGITAKKQALIASQREEVDKAILKIQKDAQKKGLDGSSVVTNKISSLELECNQKIEKINQDAITEYDDLTAQINAIIGKINGADEYFNAIFEAEIDAKVLELIAEQEKTQKEVFKYNNAIEEKCQRYKGTVATTNATLRLRYLDINTEFFSKDQLIEMGYYEDVTTCVCSYYDTMSALNAYRDIINEEKLAIYLDDYYQDLVYMYKARAGV